MKRITSAYFATMVSIAVFSLATQIASAAGASDPSSSTSALELRLRQMDARWKNMEAERQQMATEIQALQAELAKVKTENKAQAKATEEQLTTQQAAVAAKKNMIFFRGGYPDMVNTRSNQGFTDMYAKDNKNAYGPQNKERDGVYLGAGVDLSVSENLFGMMDGTEVMAEFMFDWKRWDSHQGGKTAIGTVNGAGTIVPNTAYRLGLNPGGRYLRGVTLSQFTLSASPKIKFLRGNAFRPWIIPAGMTFNFLSPPSDSGTFAGPGVMFGAGFDYNIWGDLYLGMDGRYDWVANEMDGVKASYYQIGGYIGAGF